MITSAILYAIYGIIWLVLAPFRLIPDYSLPAEVVNAFDTFSGHLMSIDAVIPITPLAVVLGVVVALEVAYWVYKFIMWVVKKIPTIS